MRVVTCVAGSLLWFMAVGHFVRAAESPGEVGDSRGQPRATILAAGIDDDELLRRSRIWYLLSQDNGSGLLLGLPQRLGKVILPSRRQDPLWQGVEDGQSVKLVIEREGGVEGEIFVGFFADSRWWLADPVQARSFDEPGDRFVCRVDGLRPGDYWIGAMVGGLPRPRALGVHRTWPAPVKIGVGEANLAELRVSAKFHDILTIGNSAPGHAGQWPKMDPTQIVAVRAVDRGGAPVPFAGVTLVERDPSLRSRVMWYRENGTDEQGRGYCDTLAGPFSIDSHRRDFVPERFASRSQHHHETQVRELAASKNVTITLDDFPTGTCKISGRVHDGAGKALNRYFLELHRVVGFPAKRYFGPLPGNVESHIQRIQIPIFDDDGKFTIEGLAPGDYAVEAADFDVVRHVRLTNKPHVHLDAPADEATVDVELEARQARYGRAVFADGKPVTRGYWLAPIYPPGGAMRGTADNFKPDGSFRVVLSKNERQALHDNAQGRIEFRSYEAEVDKKKAPMAEALFDDLSADPYQPSEIALREPEEGPPDAATEPPPKPKRKWKHEPGDIPDFKLIDTRGQTHRLADYRGKVIWLNFFGTGCAPCLREWPHLAQLSEQHSHEGLVILAICSQPAEVVEEFASIRKPPFTVLSDENRQATLEIVNTVLDMALPTNVLIDRDGRIVLLSEDFTEETFAGLRAKALELLAEQPPPGTKAPE